MFIRRCAVQWPRFSRNLASLPAHKLVPMPSLSPTMETGSIAKWFLKEGDSFEAGQAICEVETDKATVTYDASEEGFLAKILVGGGEVKVGQPLMITVDEKSFIASFAQYDVGSAAPIVSKPSISVPAATATHSAPVSVTPTAAPVTTPAASSGRVVASPYAKLIAKDSALDLHGVSGTGPNGRIVAEDVIRSVEHRKNAPIVIAHASAPFTTLPVVPSSLATAAKASLISIPSHIAGVYQDYELSALSQAVAERMTVSKQTVPHYYLSVDLNLAKLLKLRTELNSSTGKDGEPAGAGVSVLDLMVKSCAVAIKQVPDVNASWADSFVRRYNQVDINLVVGTGHELVTPVIRNVNGKGVREISSEITRFEDSLFKGDAKHATDNSDLAMGTFAIHNLGMYGVKSAAPIVLPPQACALALGAVIDTVVANVAAKEGEDNWTVAPVMTATLSCDHRVIDGAVGAAWLSAFKTIVENPISMIL